MLKLACQIRETASFLVRRVAFVATAARTVTSAQAAAVRRVAAGNYLSPEQVVLFQTPSPSRLIDTATMACELLIQLIVNERSD